LIVRFISDEPILGRPGYCARNNLLSVDEQTSKEALGTGIRGDKLSGSRIFVFEGARDNMMVRGAPMKRESRSVVLWHG